MLDVQTDSTEFAAYHPEPVARRRLHGASRENVLVGVLLVLVLLAGAYFRFVGQNWDDFTYLHPDERFLTVNLLPQLGGRLQPTGANVDEQLARCLERFPDTGGAGGYFDTECSTLNPHNAGAGFYAYGTLPLLATYWTGGIVRELAPDIFQSGTLVWRTLSAVADTATILLTFFIGLRLHNKWVGLLAAALYAAAVLPIQKAHFGTVNAMTGFFVALAILAAVQAQDRGKWRYYTLFGLAFGAALAGRVNTAPLFGVIILAAIVQAFPTLDSRLPWRERSDLVRRNFAGLVIAGIATLVMFRIFNPYAFTGIGIIPTGINPRWIEDLANARFGISGAMDSPPNWQWIGRTSYVYPLKDMLLWGMGIAFGVVAWTGWVWAGYRLLRGREDALRNLLPVIWVLVYFGWLGRQWVMTMRYYLPLYPMLALLAAWALFEILRRANMPSMATWRRAGAAALAAGVVVLTFLWAGMFTNIYRHQLTRVQATNWIWENVPGDFAMQIEGEDVPLINVAIPNGPDLGAQGDDLLVSRGTQMVDNQPFLGEFVAPADGVVTAVHSPHLGDLIDDSGPESIFISVARTGGEVALAEATLTADFSRAENLLGDSYDIEFSRPLVLEAGESYTFKFEVVAGGPVVVSGAAVAVEGDWDDRLTSNNVCTLPFGVTLADDPPSGLLGYNECNGRGMPYYALVNSRDMFITAEDDLRKRDTLQRVLDSADYLTISSNRFYDTMTRNRARWPLTARYYEALFAGELGYDLVKTFDETFELGPLRVSDQHLPTYESPQWLNEFEADEAFHVYDHPAVFIFQKRDDYDPRRTAQILESVPLSRANETAVGLFTDPALVGVVPLSSLEVDPAPTQLQLPEEVRDIQSDGGTWSDRFDRDSIVNSSTLVTILFWWLAVMLFGWIAWPLLFVLFPALSDRGYGVAKLVGILLTGWFAWLMSSLQVPLWSQGGIVLSMLLLAALSGWLGWRSREKLIDYLRQYKRRLMWIEIITALAFTLFLVVRLTNPDLWHFAKGGEKPMDFAYFNAVLRSTVFPPLDPWYAGGFINYYYFGFVIVGTPVLLLGVVPSVAYNLIIPTLFAIAGIGAFSMAFNIVNTWRERRSTHEIADRASPRRLGNPWVAGVVALLLAVVLGNLDTVRIFANGLATLGGYDASITLQSYLIDQYIAEQGNPPDGEAMVAIADRAERSDLFDRLPFEIYSTVEQISSVGRGFVQLLNGQPLPVGSDRWYWGPSRVLAEAPGVGGNAITEMPYFTFLYGDLHAHMINMPMLLFIMAFLYNELIIVRRDERGRVAKFLAVALGALAVGLVRATNTWDWPSFLLFSTVGMAYVWWLRWHGSRQVPGRRGVFPAPFRPRRMFWWLQLTGGGFTRRSLIDFTLWVGGFVALTFVLVLPYSTWYAATYNSVALWEGGKTPLWAYFDIHGLFLFLILSLLLWDTARWMRSVRVSALRGRWNLLLAMMSGAGFILFVSLVLATADYQVALVAIPLIAWIAVLFFRPDQSRPMQFVLVLVGFGLAMTLGVEFVVIGGDIGRQNTVFKFYIQTWLLFSVAGGAAFALVFESTPRWSVGLRGSWVLLVGGLFIVAAMFPLMATRARALDRMVPDQPLTLDGMTFMQYARYYEVVDSSQGLGMEFALEDDYYLIQWLQENVEGTPVIMEAQSEREYLWGGRVSIYTGLPSVVGWNWHQRQQRTFDPMPRLVQQRAANVNAFYMIPDVTIATDILQHYEVSYVILSSLERARYEHTGGLEKFDDMVEMGILDIVYQEGEGTIYQVNPDAILEVALYPSAEQGS